MVLESLGRQLLGLLEHFRILLEHLLYQVRNLLLSFLTGRVTVANKAAGSP